MSGGIEEPYTIAQLPKPLDSEHGRILAAPVHSLGASRKRKRHEVAISVDGESVNIYNTRNQSLSTSYALPPQSYLAAPPCSVYCKRTRLRQAQRRTYTITRNGPHDQKLRLASITEDLGRPQSEQPTARAPAKTDRKLRSDHVVGLDVISAHNATLDALTVVVLYRTGDIDCLAGDLSQTRWEHTETSLQGAEVEYAIVLDSATARKGLLKGREDVLALLDQSAPAEAQSKTHPLLVQIVRNDRQRQLRVLLLRYTVGEQIPSHQSPISEILRYELPSRRVHASATLHYELHAATGMLYQLLDGRLNIIDLSGTLPKVTTGLGRRSLPHVNSFARLSIATVLTFSSDKIAVYETKFGSELCSLPYPAAKAIRATGHADITPQIVTTFADLGLVVATSGMDLIAFQVGDILDDGRHSKSQGALLSDVLGKGTLDNEMDSAKLSRKDQEKRARWEDWKAQADGFVVAADVLGLEDLVSTALHLNLAKQGGLENKAANGLTNGLKGATHDVVWKIPTHAYDPEHVDRKRASYVLGCLFAWRSPDQASEQVSRRLRVRFHSHNLLRWLALAGYLTAAHIEQALPKSDTGDDARLRVAPGDIMAAIQEVDPSFKLIGDLLALPMHWDLAEVVQGLQLLIESFMAATPTSDSQAIMRVANSDVAMTDADDETMLQAAVDAATKQLDLAQNMLESGLANRSGTFRILLDRLHSFPKADVARTMHVVLSHEEIVFFICVLRLELSDAGWTRLYIEDDEEDDDADDRREHPAAGQATAQETEPSSQAIETIADLFCCAIDAVGLGGWLVGLSGQLHSTAALLTEARNEIEAVTEGLFAADLVNTLLREMTRAANDAAQQGHRLKRKRAHEEELVSEDSMLPVGGRFAPPQLRTSKTGERIRNKLAIAEEKSRSVGKYSFERIRI